MQVQKLKHKKPNSYNGINTIFDSFFGNDFFGGYQANSKKPAVNISESENAYHLDFAAPGLTKSDFNIEVIDDALVVSCDKVENKAEDAKKIRRQEFSFQTFHRSFILPENVSEEDIKAAYSNGVLSVEIPKATKEAPKKKKIEIA